MAAVIAVVEHGSERPSSMKSNAGQGDRGEPGRRFEGPPAPLQLHRSRAECGTSGRRADVVYGIVLDADGKVATHSRHPELAGRALRGAADELAVKTDTFLVQETVQSDTRESIYDLSSQSSSRDSGGYGPDRSFQAADGS